MGEALNIFADQSKLEISVPTDATDGKMSSAVVGSFPSEEALRKLLSGTGLTYRVSDGKTIILKNVADADSLLSPIKVQGRFEGSVESAYGPVEGYVANRSASGSKTDSLLIETPRSISVISADKISDLQAPSIRESLRYTPNVAAEVYGTDNRPPQVIIRGFSSYGQTYLDGLSLPHSVYNSAEPDSYGTERIEVIRGPSSTLYGQSTPGGLINSVSKLPTEEAFGEIEALGGSFNQFQGRFDVGGPIDDEKKFLYRLTVSKRDGDTQVDFLEDKRLFVAPAFTWKPTSSTTITFRTHYQKDDSSPILQFAPTAGTVLPNPNGEISSSFFTGEPGFDRLDKEQFSFGLDLEHRVNDSLKFRHKLRYDHFTLDYRAVLGNNFQADNITLKRNAFTVDEEMKALASDNNVEAKFETGFVKHTALLGLDYKYHIADELLGFGATGTLNAFNPIYGQTNPAAAASIFQDSKEKAEQVGVYLQDQMKIQDDWVLTLGGRHDWANSEIVDRLDSTSLQINSAFTGQAGLVYLFDSGIAPYASYAESFNPQSGKDRLGEPFVPTTGTQYEAGVKYQPVDYNALFTVSVFELTQQNVTTPDPDNTNFNIQTGEIRSLGVETEAIAELTENFKLSAGASYTYTEVTKSNGTNLSKRPPLIPEITASVWGDYKVPAGDLKGLGLGGGVRYVGSSYGNATNTFKAPGYALLDTAVHYDMDDGVRLGLNVSNLLDEEYIASCLGSCYFGSRRVITGSVKYRW
ncbi:MAG: TonB-dependent siderophore receptor [Candidatus Nitrohelix vancouverensis]|uniref:TonB-dependent siderophore receptor n=1 Tax=Candidatus Nitrohelix vancouverensis TaxID=2705534 RepID=A0A7T0C094_9BACT|nr:MAG: TonB-dependent siderophore receptor [Candidatus Nitrohelix vancouverensis]